MEKLGPKELENIRKLSDVRLVSNLVKASLSQDELDIMDRIAMLSRWAELIAAGAGKPAAAAATVAPVTYNVEFEKERLALEKLKIEAKIRQQERDSELANLKLQQEAHFKQQEARLKEQEMQQAMEKERNQADLERTHSVTESKVRNEK